MRSEHGERRKRERHAHNGWQDDTAGAVAIDEPAPQGRGDCNHELTGDERRRHLGAGPVELAGERTDEYAKDIDQQGADREQVADDAGGDSEPVAV